MSRLPEQHRIELPIEEMETVKRLLPFGHPILAKLNRALQPVPNAKMIMFLEKDEIGTLRDILSDHVIQSGFDENYKLTGYGEVLEGIIDRLPLL